MQTPTGRLLAGLAITLTAVAVYSWYTVRQVEGIQELQREVVERNRRDSLQLLRIQNDLHGLGLAMRDMLDGNEGYPLTAWSAQFERLRGDLTDALSSEQRLAADRRSAEQQQYLVSSLSQFWDAVDRMFVLAGQGHEEAARQLIRESLQARQAALTTSVARLLIQNNESEEQAASRISQIHERVKRNVQVFLAAMLVTILATSLYLIRSNRLLFGRLADLSSQRSELAQKLITNQEETLAHISRDLHDEFGQILTAVGAMLGRAERQGVAPDSPLRTELRAVQEVAQETLDKIRGLSQMLHPVILDEAGLDAAVDWYLPLFEKRTHIAVRYEKTGSSPAVHGSTAVHVFRVLQEALNNAVRHSQASEVFVRLRHFETRLVLEIEDHGTGFLRDAAGRGVGLVAMQERAEMVNGQIEFLRPPEGGTLVRLTVGRG